MKPLVYTLYSISKANNTLAKLAEGPASEMKRMMNRLRHTNPKEHRYGVYYGHKLVSSTNN